MINPSTASDVAIRVDGLGKQYRLGLTHDRSIRDLVERWSRRLRGSLASGNGKPPNTNTEPEKPRAAAVDAGMFWALRDVSFEIQRGEVFGIIGGNGAGKSTLLKVLSKVTKPTAGRAEIYGRVGSLLEVGTGFHPELTGRENVFLNGAILGMHRSEVQKKFDQIVSFAGVEQFIDTPVKRFSSGMKVRLGFAVAAYLEPEVLIVDEVLAVGDANFRHRCLGKMSDVAMSGRTVLFVSHDMGAVESLCTRTILLENGSLTFDGPPKSTIARYSQGLDDVFAQGVADRIDRNGNGQARLTDVYFANEHGQRTTSIRAGDSLRICIEFANNSMIDQPRIGIAVSTFAGQRLFRLNTDDQAIVLPGTASGGTVVCDVSSLPLMPGVYSIAVGISDADYTLQDEVQRAAFLELLPGDVFGTGRIPTGSKDIFIVPSSWTPLYGQN